MQQLVWKTLNATGVTGAAKAATEGLVSMAARQLTEAATAELERRWAGAAAGTGTARRNRPGSARPSRRGSGAAHPDGPARSGRVTPATPDEASLRRLRAAVAALDARIDTLGTR